MEIEIVGVPFGVRNCIYTYRDISSYFRTDEGWDENRNICDVSGALAGGDTRPTPKKNPPRIGQRCSTFERTKKSRVQDSPVSLFLGISGGHQAITAMAVRDGVVLGCVKGDGLNVNTVPHLKLASRMGALLENLSDRISLTPAETKAQTAKLVLAVPGAEIDCGQRLAEASLYLNNWTDRSQFFIADQRGNAGSL